MKKEDLEKLGFAPATRYKRIRQKSLCLGTGLLPVDFATGEYDEEGIAGIRQRDVLEAIGLNNSLKTALGISMIATTQKRFPGQSVAALFSEPFDPDRMERSGVDLDRLLLYDVYDPEADSINDALAEAACEALLRLSEEEEIKLSYIDSVAALQTKSAMFDGKKDRELDSTPVANLAKIMNNFINKFKLKNRCSVLTMINHYREPISTGFSFAPTDSTKLQSPGGRGTEFLADVRILCSSTVKMSEKPHSVLEVRQGEGYKARWTLFKNKYANTTNHRTVTGYLDFKTGLWNNEENLIEYASFFAVEDDKGVMHSKISPIVTKKLARITIGTEKFHGMSKAVEFLRENPDIYDSICKQLYELSPQFFEDHKPSIEELLEN